MASVTRKITILDHTLLIPDSHHPANTAASLGYA